VRLEDLVVQSPRGYEQLHLAAAHVDVDGFIAFGVIVQRLIWITRGLADKGFLNVASFHANVTGRTICAEAGPTRPPIVSMGEDPQTPQRLRLHSQRCGLSSSMRANRR
jgi:hypothetical protein